MVENLLKPCDRIKRWHHIAKPDTHDKKNWTMSDTKYKPNDKKGYQSKRKELDNEKKGYLSKRKELDNVQTLYVYYCQKEYRPKKRARKELDTLLCYMTKIDQAPRHLPPHSLHHSSSSRPLLPLSPHHRRPAAHAPASSLLATTPAPSLPLALTTSHSPPLQKITPRRRHTPAQIRRLLSIPVVEELEEVSETRREEAFRGRPGDLELGANGGGGADLVFVGSAAVANAPSMPLLVGVRRLRLVHRLSGDVGAGDADRR